MKPALRALAFALMATLPAWTMNVVRFIVLPYEPRYIQSGTQLPFFFRIFVLPFTPGRVALISGGILALGLWLDLRAVRSGRSSREAWAYPTHGEVLAIIMVLGTAFWLVVTQVWLEGVHEAFTVQKESVTKLYLRVHALERELQSMRELQGK